ncbi:hypothetical protein HK096_008052 [Nowakowskiella sp. JEL0078]|nr:hypothetical protein HK096_008052 [Nowakowskiella sp. JEL0078]
MAETDDLTQVSFKDTTFLQHFPLDEHNIIDYFALSQFYDRSCINEQVRMQERFLSFSQNDSSASALPLKMDARAISGVEYTVALEYLLYKPALFVIYKFYRHTLDRKELLAAYYIIEGTIYQAPNLSSLLSNRILTSLHHLQQGFQAIRSQVHFHPSRGYSWEADELYAQQLRLRSKAERTDAATIDGLADDTSIPSTPQSAISAQSSMPDGGRPKKPIVAASLEMQMLVRDFTLRMDKVLAGDGDQIAKNEMNKAVAAVAEKSSDAITPESIKRKLLKRKEDLARKEEEEAKKRAEMLAEQRRAQEEAATRLLTKRRKRDPKTPGTPGSPGSPGSLGVGSPRKAKKIQ